MTYFREFPDIEYLSPLPSKKSSLDYVRAKNLFRRVKIRDDLQNAVTLLNKYIIPDGARPELVAEELYGSAEYDWVVLISAGITRIRDQWPLSDRDIYRFSENKYGPDLNAIKFYETTEVRDSKGKLILPAGKVVDSNFTISYSENEILYTNDPLLLGNNVVRIPSPIVAISNYEYEVRKNNEKRSIYILNPIYLQQYLNDFRKEMFYTKSSQYVDKKLIRTENLNNTSP